MDLDKVIAALLIIAIGANGGKWTDSDEVVVMYNDVLDKLKNKNTSI